jgi:hypothetical protein
MRDLILTGQKNQSKKSNSLLKIRLASGAIQHFKETSNRLPTPKMKKRNQSKRGQNNQIGHYVDDKHSYVDSDGGSSVDEQSTLGDEYDENICDYDEKEKPGQNGSEINCGANDTSTNYDFSCRACDKSFKYFCYYKRHMDACHSDLPKYVCHTCNKSYKWEASFRQHLRCHHVSQLASMGDGSTSPTNTASTQHTDKTTLSAMMSTDTSFSKDEPLSIGNSV